jgi:hypothetical protein
LLTVDLHQSLFANAAGEAILTVEAPIPGLLNVLAADEPAGLPLTVSALVLMALSRTRRKSLRRAAAEH